MTTNAPDATPSDLDQNGLIAAYDSATDYLMLVDDRSKQMIRTAIRAYLSADRASRFPLAAPVAEVRARYSGEDDFGERDVSWLVKPSDLPSGTKLYSAIPAPGTAPSGTAEVEPLEFIYKNWRGEVGKRRVIPGNFWFGSTEWHPEPQWLLKALDLDKNEQRDFAIKDIAHSPAVEVREPDAELVKRLTVLTNALRAAASRGPVSSREIFSLTDPIMDTLAKHGGSNA